MGNFGDKKGELVVYYKVLNEADFIQESIASIYDVADRIVILEYCLDSMRKIIRKDRVTEHGLSTDGTTEIIKSFPDPDHKIDHRPVGFIEGDESIPYQMVVDLAQVGEYIWVMDGDIVYPKAFTTKIGEWVRSQEYDVIWIPERVFFHDLWHEQHNFFAHHQRIFRKPHPTAFYFPKCFEVHWIEDEPGVSSKGLRYYGRDSINIFPGEVMKEYPSLVCHPEKDGFAYHYALVKSNQRMLEKLLWQYEMIERRWNNPDERATCRKFGKNALEFKLNTHVWFLAHQPDFSMVVRRWGGVHPDIMTRNKWFDYYWDEKPVKLTYDEARKLVGSPGEC